jgi:hypothetical protein
LGLLLEGCGWVHLVLRIALVAGSARGAGPSGGGSGSRGSLGRLVAEIWLSRSGVVARDGFQISGARVTRQVDVTGPHGGSRARVGLQRIRGAKRV